MFIHFYQFAISTESEVKDKYSLLDLMIRDKNGFTPLQYRVKNQTTSNDLEVIFL